MLTISALNVENLAAPPAAPGASVTALIRRTRVLQSKVALIQKPSPFCQSNFNYVLVL